MLGHRSAIQLVEGWGWFDALYMTVITITTVGFFEVRPLGPAGRVFTMALALGGVFLAFYAAAEFIRAVVTGEIRTVLGRQRMESRLEKLSGHLVICGFGRMGRLVAEEFAAAGLDFVVIDREPRRCSRASTCRTASRWSATPRPTTCCAGPASSGPTRSSPRPPRTRTTSSSRSRARLINEKLLIVARAEGEGAELKLRRAGANRVVSPYTIGGHRVAQAVLRPNAMDFIELATRSEHLELQIEEVEIRSGSALVGCSLQDEPDPQRARHHHRRDQEARGRGWSSTRRPRPCSTRATC